MPNAYSLLPRDPEPNPRSVLVTGAAGSLGRSFHEYAPERYDLRLMVRPGEQLERPRGKIVEADLLDLAGLKDACRGIDTIIHLAGESSPLAEWTPLLQSNIIGVYNLFVAAKAAGCRRVVLASSIHAVSGYPEDVQIGPDAPVNPGDLYGVSKCFGEALARYMAEHEGVSSIVIRIGGCQRPERVRNSKRIGNMDAWISERDLMQLLVRCVDDESLRFAIVSGVSDNRFNRLDITSARELLGYAPEDRFSNENAALPDLNWVMRHNVLDGYPSGLRDEL